MRRAFVVVFAGILGVLAAAWPASQADTGIHDYGAYDQGAAIVPAPVGSCGSPAGLVDKSPTPTGWWAAPGCSVIIALPTAIDVSSFAIDPGPVGGDGPDAVLKDFTIETSTDSAGQTFIQSAEGSSIRGTSLVPADAGQFVSLTPTAGTGQGVRYVRLTLLSGQGPAPGPIDVAQLQVIGTTSPIVQGTSAAVATTATTTATRTTPVKKAATPKKAKTTTTPAALKIPPPHAATALRFTGGLKLGVTCAVGCSSKVTLTLSALSRRQLHTSPPQAFAHTFKVKTGTWLVTVRASPRVRQAARKHHRRTVTFVLRAVTSAGTSGTRTLTSTVHLRLY